jgi:hypothetical protein
VKAPVRVVPRVVIVEPSMLALNEAFAVEKIGDAR